MTLPKSLRIGPFTVGVSQSSKRMAELNQMDPWGYWDPALLEIVVNDDMNADLAAVSLFHEVLHAIWDIGGLNPDPKEPEDEEAIIEVLAVHIVDTLRRNPKLRTLLLGDR